MTIVAGDENNRNGDKENEVVRMVTISDRNIGEHEDKREQQFIIVIWVQEVLRSEIVTIRTTSFSLSLLLLFSSPATIVMDSPCFFLFCTNIVTLSLVSSLLVTLSLFSSLIVLSST